MRVVALLLIAVCAVGCGAVVTSTSPTTIAPAAPSRVTMTATAGLGATSDRGYVVVRVFDASGLAVSGATVELDATRGTLPPRRS